MPDRCPTCKRPKKRTSEANRRYWLLLHMIADKVKPDGNEYAAETWHTYFKMKHLGADDVRMPNGRVVAIPKSSAELPTDKFHEFVFEVEAWANERGVFLDEMPA